MLVPYSDYNVLNRLISILQSAEKRLGCSDLDFGGIIIIRFYQTILPPSVAGIACLFLLPIVMAKQNLEGVSYDDPLQNGGPSVGSSQCHSLILVEGSGSNISSGFSRSSRLKLGILDII